MYHLMMEQNNNLSLEILLEPTFGTQEKNFDDSQVNEG